MSEKERKKKQIRTDQNTYKLLTTIYNHQESHTFYDLYIIYNYQESNTFYELFKYK